MPFLHIAKGLPSCLPSLSLVVNFQPIGANFRQKRAKVNDFLGCFGVSSGISETKNGKSEIYFYLEGLQGLPVWLSIWGGGRVHWVQVVQGAGAFVALSWCVPAFVPAFCPLCCISFPA